MIRSMTGFGRGRAEGPGLRVQVDLRAVNHRFLELRCRLPFFSPDLELRIKEAVGRRMHRGKVDVVLEVEEKEEGEGRLRLNRALLRDYLAVLREVRDELGLAGEVSLDHVAVLPWGKVFEARDIEPGPEDVPVFETALESALDQLVAMREREGEVLRDDIGSRVAEARDRIAEVRERTGDLLPVYRDRLRERIRALMEDGAPDEDRILQEAAFQADRADISEEMVRLEGHLDAIEEALASSEPAVGKKLDFLLQECHREINTIGSKSRGVDIGMQVVEVKAQVEAMREQVQNVE